MSKIGVSTHVRPWSLRDRRPGHPSHRTVRGTGRPDHPRHDTPDSRRGPGRPPAVTDAELVCLAVAQVLLRYNDEHHWLRAAASRVGHLFPRLLAQPEYNERLKHAAPLMEAALRWLAEHTPGTAELLRLMDATPIGCGQSKTTPPARDCPAGPATATKPPTAAGTGASNCCSSPPPTARSPGSAWPTPNCSANAQPVDASPTRSPTSPLPAPPWSPTRAFPGRTPGSLRRPGPHPDPPRPPRRADTQALPQLAPPTGRGDHLDAEEPTRPRTPRRPGPAGLWTRIVQRLLALNAAIWHNWAIGAPVKRSLIAYDH